MLNEMQEKTKEELAKQAKEEEAKQAKEEEEVNEMMYNPDLCSLSFLDRLRSKWINFVFLLEIFYGIQS